MNRIRPSRPLQYWTAGLVLLLAAGCVSKQVEPAHTPRLMMARDSSGWVTLSWKSEPGYKYRIEVMDPKTNQWVPLPGADVFHGKGETITHMVRSNPRMPAPWFNLSFSHE